MVSLLMDVMLFGISEMNAFVVSLLFTVVLPLLAGLFFGLRALGALGLLELAGAGGDNPASKILGAMVGLLTAVIGVSFLD